VLLTQKQRAVEKPKLVQMFPTATVIGLPIFSSKDHRTPPNKNFHKLKMFAYDASATPRSSPTHGHRYPANGTPGAAM